MGGIIGIICVVQILPMVEYPDDCCSICESYWAYSALEDEEDNVLDDCGGVCIALGELWEDYNNGGGIKRTQSHLDYLEKMRLKNGYNGRSFDLINLSNPCPQSPKLEYIGTGLVTEFIPWSYNGPIYSITKVYINGSEWTFNNCGADVGSMVHVFKQKNSAWHWKFKEAKLFDASKYPLKPLQVNESWLDWEFDYQLYLDNGGIDVGDQYWM